MNMQLGKSFCSNGGGICPSLHSKKRCLCWFDEVWPHQGKPLLLFIMAVDWRRRHYVIRQTREVRVRDWCAHPLLWIWCAWWRKHGLHPSKPGLQSPWIEQRRGWSKEGGRPPKTPEGKKKVSHTQSPPAVCYRTRKVEVVAIHKGYQMCHSESTRKKVEPIEDRITQKRAQIPDTVVDAEVGRVIPDPGHSRGRDSKFAKIVDLYWHVKEMVTSKIRREEVKT